MSREPRVAKYSEACPRIPCYYCQAQMPLEWKRCLWTLIHILLHNKNSICCQFNKCLFFNFHRTSGKLTSLTGIFRALENHSNEEALGFRKLCGPSYNRKFGELKEVWNNFLWGFLRLGLDKFSVILPEVEGLLLPRYLCSVQRSRSNFHFWPPGLGRNEAEKAS